MEFLRGGLCCNEDGIERLCPCAPWGGHLRAGARCRGRCPLEPDLTCGSFTRHRRPRGRGLGFGRHGELLSRRFLPRTQALAGVSPSRAGQPSATSRWGSAAPGVGGVPHPSGPIQPSSPSSPELPIHIQRHLKISRSGKPQQAGLSKRNLTHFSVINSG